ncbi:BMC domain-containing protein [Lacrimispora sphenoides]|uniref:Carboxysome shell and ethanolamine utilization microcompartment protein CcmL/EutN n=1 Tax=Lacrimispora sphenoides JCM 1415 TaxID=1297793 RepID=A0ABY1C465_9FIRM|nr:BMC domain-containing protein [Lacrimispora sphenoides]SET63324.1 Carboxysome shell and ethanolamine utilization microcompartment protein CcmL/EutN [[Clostridium] sphenoides JCM 1415]SUY50175.1 microcompartments protein [Lacrimispora sphenoides]
MAKALGLIEVRGKLGVILAADAAAKEADVNLLGSETIRGGLTTIHIIGDIAAVKAAVKAGEVAVADKNCLISSHVIPRLDDQVEQMLMKSFGKKEDNPSDTDESNQPIIEEIEKDEDSPYDKGQLEKMRVTDLRSLAYKSNLSTIKRSEIKSANKAVLIETLLNKGVKYNGID